MAGPWEMGLDSALDAVLSPKFRVVSPPLTSPGLLDAGLSFPSWLSSSLTESSGRSCFQAPPLQVTKQASALMWPP